jgi:hypothetical protein
MEKYVVSNSRPSQLLIEIGKFQNMCAADALSDVWLAHIVLIQSNPHSAWLLDWASVRPMQKSVFGLYSDRRNYLKYVELIVNYHVICSTDLIMLHI